MALPVLMIVDDEPQNLHVLERMLRQDGYHVLAFPRGDLALKALEHHIPDLILLDIRMPAMNGYEVCSRLKQMEKAKSIPVIFLSALSESSDKVRAFEAGGVDYVTKPLSQPEVLARVRTHLSLHKQRLHLSDLVRQHTSELAQAHHHLQVWDTAKTNWIYMLAHELRTPLTSLFCIVDILFQAVTPGTDTAEIREDFKASSDRIRKLIADATMLASSDINDGKLKPERVDLNALVASTVDERLAKDGCITYMHRADTPGELPIHAVPHLLGQAICDLCVSAACCEPPKGRVTLTTRKVQNRAVLEIATDGKNLPPEHLATFFDVGGQQSLLRGGADYGLAPALARRIVHLFNGTIGIENGAGKGVRITASFLSLGSG